MATRTQTRDPSIKPGEALNTETGEIVSMKEATGAVAVTDDDEFYGLEQAIIDPVRQVTIPVLKWPANGEVICKITNNFVVGKEVVRSPPMAPPTLCVVQGVRGQLRTLIVGSVLKSELMEAYPDHGYVGRWFAFKKKAPEKFMNEAGEMVTKRYATYMILEIRDPEANLNPKALPAN